MIDLLRRFIDPIGHRRIAEDRRRQREVREVKSPSDPPSDLVSTCRVCGWKGSGKFCMQCLAGTMEHSR